MIEIKNLTVSYKTSSGKVDALKNLNLKVEKGVIFGYLGPNGAGKTTTIKAILSLIKNYKGECFIEGIPSYLPNAREKIGFLPENPSFYNFLTGKESLDFFGKLFGIPRQERKRRIIELTEKLNLKEILNREIRTYSKGQRQRFGFAQALINDPELLILDEPLSGLDPIGRLQIKEIIRDLNKQGKTIFFSSHILPDVEAICDYVGLLYQGRLIQEGSIEDVLYQTLEGYKITIEEKDINFKGIEYVINKKERYSELIVKDKENYQKLLKEIITVGYTIKEITPLQMDLENYFIRKIKENENL